MSEEITTVEEAATPQSNPTAMVTTWQVHPVTIDVSVSAETREGIAHGQEQLTRWCERKVATEKADYEELNAAYEEAKKQKWKTITLKAHATKAKKRVEYYEKMLAAFAAGYILIPNFTMTIFAIRTGKKFPLEMASFQQWDNRTQKADLSAIGESDYQNPRPDVFRQDVRVVSGDKAEVKTKYFCGDWSEIEFPMSMAKPHLMQAVSHAMSLKLFDEIGILPLARTKGDPMIGGVIKMRTGPYDFRSVTFMMAWHVDTRTL